MEIKNIKTYNNAPEKVFETLCSQLFENWLNREFDDISYFSVVNGAGGDGGVEAYAIRKDKSIIGLQAKWFTASITSAQISQIKKSIITAKEVRPDLKIYVVCIPRDTQSTKKGRNKVISSNTEEFRLAHLKEDIKGLFKDLEVIFWKETQLITELKHRENDGLIKLWFEKEELSFETLLTRFELAKSGWLSDRYFPDLHNRDVISKIIDETSNSEKFRKATLDSLHEVIDNLAASIELIKYYIEKNDLDESLNNELEIIRSYFRLYHTAYTDTKKHVVINQLPSPISIKEVKIFPSINKLESTIVPNLLKENHRKLKSLLFSLHQTHLSQHLDNIRHSLKPHNYLILGGPGTGKTHGVAFEVEDRLKKGEPALLIRAKDCEKLMWKTILSDSLGCCSDWSDIEILSALSSLTRINSVSLASKEKANKFINHSTKFIICVDGIDESINPEKWKDLINETKVWLDKFPNIRFIFTCRSYAPSNQNPFSLPHDDIKIYRKDINIESPHLVFDYLGHFEIKYENTPWVISSFENNLALRLFCEEFKGKDLSKEFDNPVFNSSRNLLEKKVDRLHYDFNSKLDKLNPPRENFIKKTLGCIAKLLIKNNKIEKNELRQHLYLHLDEMLTKTNISYLLDFLTDHGFLTYYSEPTPEYGSDNDHYEVGIQTYFEYLVAEEYARTIYKDKLVDIPSELLDQRYTYTRTLIGLTLLNNYDRLVGSDGIWQKNFSDWELLKLQFDILSIAPKKLLEKHKSFLNEVFLVDRDRFITHFALQNSSRQDFNIIEEIIHQNLLKFESTYERDLFWSGPDNHQIEGHSHLSFCFEYNTLFILSKHNQEPLLYAWSLSTTSRPILEKIKVELTQWALNDLEEFVKLLELLFWDCDDGQIQEGLATVIYGLSSLVTSETPKTLTLIEWIENNIFHPSKIIKNKNSVIRHSCHCFIEQSFKFGLCGIKSLKASQPPYKYNEKELLSFDSNQILKQVGMYPVERDLYWDRIEDAYIDFIKFDNKNLSDDVANILRRHNCSSILPKEFFTRVAVQFIKNLGWNNEDVNADIGSYQFMTFEEKYTSLAIHHIQGYLGDRITYKENGNSRLKDYSLILHINNPAHQEFVKIEYLNNNAVKWFIPEDISPIINEAAEDIKNNIKSWTTNKREYDFAKWLFPEKLNLLREKNKVKDEWLVLASYTALSDPNKIGRAWLDINCVLLKAKEYKILTKHLRDKDNKVKLELKNFKAGINGHVYNSLVDVIRRDNISEYNQEISLVSDIYAYPTVAALTERSASGHDVNYDIPSAKLRSILGINSTDKVSFSKDNTLLIINHSTTEDNTNYQKMLLSDKHQTTKALETNNLFPVWICTEFRSTMDNIRLNKNKAHWQNCRKWICISTEQTIVSFLIHNDYYCT